MGKLKLDWEAVGSHGAKVTIEGQVDSHNSQELEVLFDRIVNKEQRSKLDIDLEGLDYISSSGIGVFIATLKDSQDMGGRLKLLNPQDHIRAVFAMIGLDALAE